MEFIFLEFYCKGSCVDSIKTSKAIWSLMPRETHWRRSREPCLHTVLDRKGVTWLPWPILTGGQTQTLYYINTRSLKKTVFNFYFSNCVKASYKLKSRKDPSYFLSNFILTLWQTWIFLKSLTEFELNKVSVYLFISAPEREMMPMQLWK